MRSIYRKACRQRHISYQAMAKPTGLAAALPHIVLPSEGLLLPQNISPLDLEQRFVNEVDRSLTECAPGYSWNAELQSCTPVVMLRTASCPYGYVRNIRLNECRRGKYNVQAQDGTIKKWWDSVFNRNKGGSNTAAAAASTPKPGSAADLATHIPPRKAPSEGTGEGWYGYGYNFGRHEPHW